MMMVQISDENVKPRPGFQSLLELHGQELYAYLWRMMGDPQDAEDCLQDTFLRAFRAFDRTGSEWNYRAWLYKIATNVARTQLKKARPLDPIREDERDLDQSDPIDVMDRKEQFTRVLDAMAQLSFRQRTAIMLRKYNDLDYGMIGEALGCTPETARAHVYQGLKRLRKMLEANVVAEGS